MPCNVHLLSMVGGTGNWSERLLGSMYFVTAQHGAVFPHEIERLWSTVAGNKRNIIPILDYVVSKGQLECGQVQPVLLHTPACELQLVHYLHGELYLACNT